MAWMVTMDEDGVINLPSDLIDKLGWTSEMLLYWADEEDGVSLSPARPGYEPGTSA